ncbi:hypothetical protein O4H49_04335 [Kiloniella laminariae]|uniref:SD-repeat containing protein B domain-containing protein n=1 Tax=Kiloniella laminariae TaxID=454162 RepID=A0ABT4LFW7_9PROT|nr:hypothetical protein [Kiloniella laminariae]MCZ4279993.1 hypothetical protein [Kiloniella laminariae]
MDVRQRSPAMQHLPPLLRLLAISAVLSLCSLPQPATAGDLDERLLPASAKLATQKTSTRVNTPTQTAQSPATPVSPVPSDFEQEAFPPPTAGNLTWAERPDDEIFVFGLQLERYTLSDAFLIFYDGREAFVPLGSFLEALEFPITVDPESGTASGWYLNDDRAFSLDLHTSRVSIEGRVRPITPGRVERHPDDLYVSLSELESWFPLLLEVQFQELQISIRPLEPLPLQERIAREIRRAHLTDPQVTKKLQRIEPENDWFEWPFVDTSIQISGRNTANERQGQARQTTTVAGIIGGLDSEATTIASTDLENPNMRLRMGRQSLSGGLLGPLDARSFTIGDVSTPDLPLVAQNAVGRGFEISSFDLDRLEQTNRVTLRGELPIGWEVEVYRNGELLDFQTDQDIGNGRYEFVNLPTLSGFNEFRLVFFGPQGQKREEYERYFVSPELAEPDRTSFRLAFNQANRDLISFDDQQNSKTDDGENRFIFQAEHGLGETLSVTAGLALLSVDGERRQYLSTGAQTTLFGTLGNLDLAIDDTGGLAIGGRAQTQLGSWSLFGEQVWYQDFHSEQSGSGTADNHLRSSTTARINGHLPDFGLGHQPVSASIAHERGEDGNWQTTIFNRLSTVVRPLNLALSSNTRLSRDQETQSDARLLVSTLVDDFRLRGELGFDVAPDSQFTLAAFTTDWRINQDMGARAGLRHSRGEESITTASLGLNRQYENFYLGLNVDADSKGDYSARLGLSFSFGHNPANDTIEVRGRPFARQSAVSAQVFLDRDNDGQFGPGDEAIENAGFSGTRLPRETTTDQEGAAFVVGLQPYKAVDIALNEATLEDPYWMSAQPARQLVMRPGTTTSLQFPVIMTGEIDGIALLSAPSKTPLKSDPSQETSEIPSIVAPGETPTVPEIISDDLPHDIPGNTRGDIPDDVPKNLGSPGLDNSGQNLDLPAGAEPGTGLKVRVHDSQGTLVAESITAYDGFFFINRIPYGHYRLSLDPEQLALLGFEPGPTQELTITDDQPFAESLTLTAIKL